MKFIKIALLEKKVFKIKTSLKLKENILSLLCETNKQAELKKKYQHL